MAGPLIYDRILETSTTTGTGTYTLAGAVTGYQTFAAVGNSNTCPYAAWEVDGNGNPSGDWEVGIGTYTSAGTTLARTSVLSSSNSGAAVNWSAGTRRIGLTFPANYAGPMLGGFIPGGRLTTESGVTVSTSDRTAQGTLYYTPHIHNQVRLYTGSVWKWCTFAEMSLSLTITSGKNYDVFLDHNGGTPQIALSAAWTNDTTRADALSTQDGVIIKSGDSEQLWLGVIRASGTNVVADSLANRYVWNYYNKVMRRLSIASSTSHSYNGGYRQWNADSANKVEFVTGLPYEHIHIGIRSRITWGAATLAAVGAGIDTTSGVITDVQSTLAAASDVAASLSLPSTIIGIGYHYVSANESTGSGGSQTFPSFTLHCLMEA